MDKPPTQRDQFNNDDVKLVDALIREAVQNSLDAKSDNGSKVFIKIKILEFEEKKIPDLHEFLKKDELKKHLEASRLDGDVFNARPVRALLIEDYGTSGLTGSIDLKDENPFSDFWRCIGVSHKGGRNLGRWGLGKLVFSGVSSIRTFFGVTKQEGGHPEPLLMGQAVLLNHSIDGDRYDSHGFYSQKVEENGGLQIPVVDPQEVGRFCDFFGVERAEKNGLSILIPYLIEGVDERKLLDALINNYFFPILFEKLVVEINDKLVDSSSFYKYAKLHGGNNFSEQMISFVKEMKEIQGSSTVGLDLTSRSMREGLGGAVSSEEGDELRNKLSSGALVDLKWPVLLKNKKGEEFFTHFSIYMKKASDGGGGALFVRDAIVLTAEKKHFRGPGVFAAMVADDASISDFLGDAENPAHTTWSGTAEKVSRNWKSVSGKLREVRRAPQELYNFLFGALEHRDDNALLDLFSLEGEEKGKIAEGRGRDKTGKPASIPPPRAKSYRVSRHADGFSISGTGKHSREDGILVLKVRIAYDVLRGSPLSKFSDMDFDLRKGAIKIKPEGATCSVESANSFVIEAGASDFKVVVTGFDTNRDLFVSAMRSS
ncbi:hypothetical protein [Alloalcanivorax marinus]|uniref:hypothetical protein n=1 Tax=Alloalcanivorax marinus TaxID=1177169 RepID=UPI00195CA064|nr:hypothetical protein [Alloalcanivorax marinus]MBM7332886.1 hypothetical protein [Alloalcanivorax marinus]